MNPREQDRYALVLRVQRGPGNEAPFRTCKLVDGERALPLYTSAEAAEAHLMLENLGPEWGVAEVPKQELDELLAVITPRGVRYVTINPPIALADAPPTEIETILIENL